MFAPSPNRRCHLARQQLIILRGSRDATRNRVDTCRSPRALSITSGAHSGLRLQGRRHRSRWSEQPVDDASRSASIFHFCTDDVTGPSSAPRSQTWPWPKPRNDAGVALIPASNNIPLVGFPGIDGPALLATCLCFRTSDRTRLTRRFWPAIAGKLTPNSNKAAVTANPTTGHLPQNFWVSS